MANEGCIRRAGRREASDRHAGSGSPAAQPDTGCCPRRAPVGARSALGTVAIFQPAGAAAGFGGAAEEGSAVNPFGGGAQRLRSAAAPDTSSKTVARWTPIFPTTHLFDIQGSARRPGPPRPVVRFGEHGGSGSPARSIDPDTADRDVANACCDDHGALQQNTAGRDYTRPAASTSPTRLSPLRARTLTKDFID